MQLVRKSKIPVMLSIIFSLLVIVYVLYQLDWHAVKSIFVGLRWSWVVLAFGVYIINYILRTWRLQTLMPVEKVPFYQLFGLTGLYGMYNYILPLGSGELTLVALLKYRLKVSVTDGVASLIAARYFDFSAIALMLTVVLLLNWVSFPTWIIYISIAFCSLVVLLNLVVACLLIRSSMFSWKISRRQWVGWGKKLQDALIGLRTGLIRIYQKKAHFRLLLITLAIWVCVYTNYYLIVIGMGYKITYFQIVVVSIIMIPMTILPIQGFANFGTHEIGWVVAFSLFGQPRDVALSIAFSSHIILLFSVLLLGVCSYLIGALSHVGATLRE